MTDQPSYVVFVCEGRRCVPILNLADAATTEAEALGRAVLVETGSGRRIASVRVGPVARRRG